MNKRGQIYILAVIILALVLVGIASIVNKASQEKIEGDFERLSENYDEESARFVNSLVFSEDIDMVNKFRGFTSFYSSYAKSQNPGFGLIYAFSYKSAEGNKVNIGNFLDQSIYIKDPDIGELSGCYDKISATIDFDGISFLSEANREEIETCNKIINYQPEIWIQIGEDVYSFEIIPGQPQLVVVSRFEKNEQRKVFIGGSGFKTEGKDDFCLKFPNDALCK
ncbi:MAG: hypothetical protein PHG05_03090 [Candidatus Nanoarchaeia archaeon]|nr:hypothetical protein [Candidatus Nanoarchaeia archaeon]